MILIESSVWVDFFRMTTNTQTLWLRENFESTAIGLTDLTLCEVLQGYKQGKLHAEVRSQLLELNVHTTGGTDLALAASDNFIYLRKRGITIRGTVDCLIASYCIRGGHELLHNDRDFEPFERYLSLKVIHA
jgi:predicted nucleic acid-binding protein